MDHLEYGDVLKSKLGIQQFRCYCYDSVIRDLHKQPDFHSFRDGRDGWDLTLAGELERVSSDSPFPDDATSFVQRWLYFEVLRELFYGVAAFNVKDFVEHDGTNYLLKTSVLPYLLVAWSESLESSNTQWSSLTRAQDVLVTAQSFILKLDARSNQDGHASSGSWSNVEDNAILSIIILGETLMTAVRKIQLKLSFEAPGWKFLNEQSCGWGYTASTLRAFELNGWTEEAVKDLMDRCMKTTNALVHALVYQLPPLDVSPQTLDYQPRHFCQGSSCSLIELLDYKDVIHILGRGDVPLFQYTPETQTLTVHPRSNSTEQSYVAISHVGSEGFGNSSRNAMPHCVLEFFAKLFPSDVSPQECSYEHIGMKKTHLFWIDTLGVPVAQHLKKVRARATSQQHSIFAQATATFVLDSGLLRQTEKDPCAIGMSIGLSNWARRLSTLQDAMLSRELFFVLQQETISSIHLDQRLEEYGSKLHDCVSQVARQYGLWILWSTNVLDKNGEVKITDAKILAQVWRAVQRREVSHPEHETAALAALFGVEIDDSEAGIEYSGTAGLNDLDDTKRKDYLNQQMKMFIILLKKLQASIPAAFLFLPGPYLPFPGFRWAPRTWLTHIPAESIEHYSRDERSCSLTLEGLKGQLPGFRLHELDIHVHSLEGHKDFYFASDYTLQDWFLVAKISNKSKPWFHGTYTNLALVCQSHAVDRQPQTALLVSILEFRNPLHQLHYRATILRQVQINKVTDPSTLNLLRSQFRNTKQEIACYGEYLPKAEWILDGAEQTDDEATVQTSTSWGHKVAAVAKFAGLLKAVRQRYGSPTLPAVNAMEPVPSIGFIDQQYTEIRVPTGEEEHDKTKHIPLDSNVRASTRRASYISGQLTLQIPKSPSSDATTSIAEIWDLNSALSASTKTRTIFSEPQSYNNKDKANIFRSHVNRPSSSSIVFREPHRVDSDPVVTVVKQADRKTIEAILQEPWISELKDVGLSDEAIWTLLEEDQLDTPWIRFIPRPKANAFVYPDYHNVQCIHNWQPERRIDAARRENSAPTKHNISDFPDTMRDIYELCGLAGALPEVDERLAASNSVRFNYENTLARVDYAGNGDDQIPRNAIAIWSEIKSGLDRFCHAVGLAQAASLCCDSFTVVIRDEEKLQLRAIPLEDVLSLQEALGSIRRLVDMQRSHRKRISKACMRLLKHCGIFPVLNEPPSNQIVQHYCALAAQFLCLGFTSYIQAHLNLPKFFFLDTTPQVIHLDGILSSLDEDTFAFCIEACTEEITCLRAGTEAPLFAFQVYSKSPDATEDILREEFQPASKGAASLDVQGSIEDIVDTWGPANLILNGHDLVAIGILGGYIVSIEGSKCHFALRFEKDIRTFEPINFDQMVLIGRPASVNLKCPWKEQESHCIMKTPAPFLSIGGSSDYWTYEPQVGLTGGLFATLHVNAIGKKHEGSTWKREQLERFRTSDGMNLNECLNSMWGLQVSYCTNVARRIPLHKVLGELIPKIYSPDSQETDNLWTRLIYDHEIVTHFRSNSVQELLPTLDEETSKFLKKLILNTLQILEPTGLDRSGNSITLAWPTLEDNQKSRVVDCRGDNSWIRLLRDTAKSATFAYISMECLETTDHKCRGPTANPAWQDQILHLETQVGPKDILSRDQNYYFEQLSGPFVMRAEDCRRHNAIRLFVPFLRTPTKFQARVIQRFLTKNSSQLWERRNNLGEEELRVSHVVVGQRTMTKQLSLHEIVARDYR